MNILLFDFGSYIQPDLLFFLQKEQNRCHNVYYDFSDEDRYHNEKFEALFEREWEKGDFDCVMSTNFFPVIAKMCARCQTKYLAWHYDSPMNLPTTEHFDYDTNYIFLFDYEECRRLKKTGLETVYHLPLAVNCDRLDRAELRSPSPYACDVSMVGSLYASTLPVLTSQMTDYDKGYIDAIVRAQSDLYGAYLVDDLLTKERVDAINAHYRELSATAMQISDKQLSYAIATQITHAERLSLLRLLSQSCDVLLCAGDLSETEARLLPDVKSVGRVDYWKEMPLVFKSSKINLNATVRCTQSAIPLRALDIMGCGGFLLSNYQSEMAAFLAPDEELVLYGSVAEAIDKATYYLAHEEERGRIARKGYERMRADFTYEARLRAMFETAGLI